MRGDSFMNCEEGKTCFTSWKGKLFFCAPNEAVAYVCVVQRYACRKPLYNPEISPSSAQQWCPILIKDDRVSPCVLYSWAQVLRLYRHRSNSTSIWNIQVFFLQLGRSDTNRRGATTTRKWRNALYLHTKIGDRKCVTNLAHCRSLRQLYPSGGARYIKMHPPSVFSRLKVKKPGSSLLMRLLPHNKQMLSRLRRNKMYEQLVL